MSVSLVSIAGHLTPDRDQDSRRYWQRRARKAERLLSNVLGHDWVDLTDDQRARMLEHLYGHPGQRRRNAHGLSDCEQEVVEHYRATDARGREMIRMLFDRFARTNPRNDASAKAGDE